MLLKICHEHVLSRKISTLGLISLSKSKNMKMWKYMSLRILWVILLNIKKSHCHFIKRHSVRTCFYFKVHIKPNWICHSCNVDVRNAVTEFTSLHLFIGLRLTTIGMYFITFKVGRTITEGYMFCEWTTAIKTNSM